MVYDSKQLLSGLNKVVSLSSISSTNPDIDSSNRAVIEFLAAEFEELGFSCDVIPTSGSDDKFNLIATLGSGPGGLVLAGHTDTVPLDEELWSVNPFSVTEKEGKLFGLGITDMKGFFPIIMEAVKPLLGQVFGEPLIILATSDEETSMQGAKTIAALGKPKARAAVIGEPTSLSPVRAHKGIMMESVRLLGQSGHSSNPALGNNALDAMHSVIGDLMVYRDQLKQRYASTLFEVPYPTLNLGCIHGGDNPNRICGSCELEFDVRLMPGMHIDTVRQEIKSRVETIAEPLGLSVEIKPLFSGVPPFFADKQSELLEAAERISGHSSISVAFGTEGPFLQELGMDTIIMGPGNIDQAHQPDEYMSIDMIEPCISTLQKLIAHYCLKNK
ncbi:MAG: acetylornithine deacetylase [Pseudohongiellaceae bacterium]